MDLEIGGEGDDLVMLILIWGSRWSNQMMLDMSVYRFSWEYDDDFPS